MTTETTRLTGFARILAHETNISDLLQFLTDTDPQPWEAVVGFVPHASQREAALGRSPAHGRTSADLRLTDADGVDRALVEVKLGHSFSEEQRMGYEDAAPGARLLLTGLRRDEGRVTVTGADRWTFVPLATLFGLWTSSDDASARTVAALATPILEEWDVLVESVFQPEGSPARRTVSDVHRKFLARVVTRHMAYLLRERGHVALAQVTSGGGLGICQGWVRLDGDADHRYVIAEVRWHEGMSGAELRFGVDFEQADNATSRAEAWRLARAMDDAIRAPALVADLEQSHARLATLLTCRGDGRPPRKGDWEEVVARGFASRVRPDGVAGNRRQIHPDFYGDGTNRYEALTRVDTSSASAADLVDLIDATLGYLVRSLPGTLPWDRR